MVSSNNYYKNFDEKINLLYEVMVDCIDARGFATVNGSLLTHPIYKTDSFNQVREMNPTEYELVNQENINVQTGIFGADMKVNLINDGPVTIILDSEEILRKNNVA